MSAIWHHVNGENPKYDDPYYDHHEEIRTTSGPRPPRTGSLEDAKERGYDKRDEYED